jgi:hypothetical protein
MAEKKYTKAQEQAQRQAVLAAIESGKSFAVAAADAGVSVERAKALYEDAVRLQHSTTQESVSTDPLPEV